ncbi:MAG: ABC transporter substrate-binding protein/permease [Kiritimatiellae bacterium]|nr:ABC transporter substrate-binding protein/permease [Kiritimatiellia bacterium]
MNIKKLLIKLLACALVATCGFANAQEPARKVIRMVTEATFPPYEYRENGRIVGIDPDIVREIAQRNGYELVIEDMQFGSLLAAVQTAKADVAAAGITVTEDRKKAVAFTDTYIEAGLVVVVPKDSPIKTIEDLADKRIGVQLGTTGDTHVTENKIGRPERYDSSALVCAAIKSGSLDAGVIDIAPAKEFVKRNKDLVIIDTPLTFEEYAFAINQNRQDLLDMFNKTLADMKEEGLIKHIAKNHMGKVSSAPVVEQVAEESGFWEDFKDDLKTNFVDDHRYRYLLDGFFTTIQVSAGAVVLGILIGFLVAVIRSAADQTGKLKLANAICKLYLTVIRGTPVVVQLLIIYFVIFGSVDISKVLIAVIAFGLNSGAYVAEIIRSGIMSIDKGQLEAGRSLGLSYPKTMVLIILPQAFKNVLPALGNEFIVLLKETSISGYIALEDLTKGGDIIRGQTYNAFVPLMAVAIIYLIVVVFLSKMLALLEKRLKRNE